MNRLLKELLVEKEKLENIIDFSENVIKNAPQGKVRVSKCHNSKQFYYHDESSETPNGKYMRKSEEELASRIVEREYYEKLLKVCYKRNREIEKMISCIQSTEIEEVYELMPKIKRECFDPVVISKELFRQRWESKVYEGKIFAEDYPEIYSEKGERVRSKTEKIIADKLYKEGIPYRYEESLELKDRRVIYPDFKILNIENRKEIILEHFGMMDDENYVSKTLMKLKLYEKSGFVLGKDLLITFETSIEPFDSRQFDRMLREHGLK